MSENQPDPVVSAKATSFNVLKIAVQAAINNHGGRLKFTDKGHYWLLVGAGPMVLEVASMDHGLSVQFFRKFQAMPGHDLGGSKQVLFKRRKISCLDDAFEEDGRKFSCSDLADDLIRDYIETARRAG